MTTATQNRYRTISVVPEGDGFVLGRPGLADFVAVPEIGGRIIQWLQTGESVETCAARAGELAGQEVDVADFLADLEAAGVLSPETEATGGATAGAVADETVAAQPPGHRIGKILYGPIGLAVHGVIAVTGLVLFLTRADLRPNYHDAIPFQVPVQSLLTMAALVIVVATVHEFAHKLAAARVGVHGRISFGRRLFTIMAQTDLTGLWALPRKKRFVPLAVGLLTDTTIAGLMIILQATFADALGPVGVSIARGIVFIDIGAIVGQASVYLRSDFYALFLVLTGSRNLWTLKGALARRLIRRTTTEDELVIDDARPREVFWARFYLGLYLPGIAFACWYYVTFRIRATIRLIELSLHSIRDAASVNLLFLGGILALLLILVPLSVGLIGALRSAYRTLSGMIRQRPVAVAAGT